MPEVTINLKKRSYPIVIGSGILKDMGRILRKRLDLGASLAIVTNPAVRRLHWFGQLRGSLIHSRFKVGVVEIPALEEFRRRPDLEEFKNNEMVMRLHSRLLEPGFRLDRASTVLACGGGCTGDLVAFAASTYMRGINLIHLPTTLLAQVDSAIGGKTGINLPEGKNLVGTFYQPRLVLIDIETLRSKEDLGRLKRSLNLPPDFWPRELRGGFAEVVKYGVIKDRALFYLLERNLEAIRDIINIRNWTKHRDFLIRVITRCCEIKARVVERDERETKGLREILNYGHTIGHALEQAGRYRLLHHGEAVSIGMVAASRIARKMDILKERDSLRQENLLKAIGLPTGVKSMGLKVDRVMKAVEVDKKTRGGALRFILPKRIGEVIISSEVPSGLIRRALEELVE